MEHISRIPQLPVVRFLIAALIVGGFAFYFGFTPAERSGIGLTAARFAGYCAPAVGIALLVGFLAWRWQAFWVTLAVSAGFTVLLWLNGYLGI